MINEDNIHLFQAALNHTNVGLVITDPSLDSHPIVFVNEGFTQLTGYSAEETIGNNCKFLQGSETSERTTQSIREAIQNRESITVQIYNYTKTGQGFWNELTIDPMWVNEKD